MRRPHLHVHRSTLNATATEFVPRNMATNTSQWASYAAQHHQFQAPEYDPHQQLTQAVSTLIYAPDNFDATAEHLVQVFHSSVTDLVTLKVSGWYKRWCYMV